jgi:pyridoxal phosphate enzyme (YggS family)
MMKSFCVVPDRFASKIIRNVKERQSLVRRTRQGELEPPLLDFELAADAAALQFCMPSIAENVERVREQIAQAAEKAGRAIGEIELVAITKAHPAEKVREAIEAGQTLFGESRVQEARAKIPELPSNMHWHFVGHLQKNKIRHALPLFELFHGVDSLVLAQEMNRIAADEGMHPRVLLEVNVAGEGSKFGFAPDKLREQIEQLLALQRLSILGLMTIPPLADKAEPSRKYFVQLRELRDLIQTEFHVDLRQLSMGMTQDFPIAVEEGATLVRVGTAIFGERFRLKKDLATDEH